MAQRPFAFGDRAAPVLVFALSGDHQNQPQPARICGGDKTVQRWMGLRQSHAMQIDPRFGHQLAPLHFPERLAIHLKRCRLDPVGNRGQQIVRGLAFCRLPDAEGRDWRGGFHLGLFLFGPLGFGLWQKGRFCGMHPLGRVGNLFPKRLFFGAKFAAAGHWASSSAMA